MPVLHTSKSYFCIYIAFHAHKQVQTDGCILSIVAADVVKHPGHQHPQCWLDTYCIKPASYKYVKIIGQNIGEWSYMLKQITQSFTDKI